MSAVDVEAVRADTPGCTEVIHLNNAGASLVPASVLTAVVNYQRAEAHKGAYETEAARSAELDQVYQAGALLLGCRADELAFTTSATAGWWAAANSVKLIPGDRVLATSAEYVANAFGLIQMRDRGIDVELIPDDELGQVSIEALTKLLDERVKLVCVTHVPTDGGLVNPVEQVGRVVADSDALFLVDAAQSVGQIPVAVEEIGCDFLVTTGRKFLRGPRGTGLLYVRSGVEGLVDPRMMDGRSAGWTGDWSYELAPGARRYETFETNLAAKAGFGAAIEYALRVGLDSIAKRVEELADGLRERLRAQPLVSVEDGPGRQSGIVTFSVDGRSARAVVAALRAWGVNTSLVSPEPGAFDPTGRTTRELIRASVHYFNTEEELDVAVAAL
ncbi:MAG: aminotransferase class V-fold PLP-dependent enzyme [Acidimicrobiales bacterium]